MFSFFKKEKKEVFKFKEPKDTACFTCDHVLDQKMPILYVSHDREGDWQFLCGQVNHEESNAKVISLGNASDLDVSVNALFEMPKGIGAERSSVQERWVPFKL